MFEVKRALRDLTVLAATVVLCTSVIASGPAGAASPHSGPVPAPPLPAPSPQSVFNGYVLGAFQTARLGTPHEIFRELTKDDPFYNAPHPSRSASPGTLLRSKKVDVMFQGVKPGRLSAYKIMYISTGVDGRVPVVATGIVMIPDSGPPPRSKSIIGYQEANDSVGGGCHPSSQWTGRNPLDGASWSALGPLALMLGTGEAVVIPDVGNDGDRRPHGVFAGKFAGHTLLDALRAATQVTAAGLNPRAPIGLFGVAGGGVGAAEAATAARTYAPELNIKATVLEGMVVDPRNFLRVADGSIGSGFGFALLLGLEPWYPDMKVDSLLNPAGLAVANLFRTQCQDTYFLMPLVPLKALFNNGISPADQPTFQRAFTDNRLGPGSAPSAPVLISSCAKDDSFMSLVPAKDARGLAQTWRDKGADVTYAPTDCSMARMLTDLYGWGSDLFGMQMVQWLSRHVGG